MAGATFQQIAIAPQGHMVQSHMSKLLHRLDDGLIRAVGFLHKAIWQISCMLRELVEGLQADMADVGQTCLPSLLEILDQLKDL